MKCFIIPQRDHQTRASIHQNSLTFHSHRHLTDLTRVRTPSSLIHSLLKISQWKINANRSRRCWCSIIIVVIDPEPRSVVNSGVVIEKITSIQWRELLWLLLTPCKHHPTRLKNKSVSQNEPQTYTEFFASLSSFVCFGHGSRRSVHRREKAIKLSAVYDLVLLSV